ncbi:MAG: hypothetical protein HOI33_09745, partial [Rhodospirillaceae bacterium]|nr:hypothetical protein [Rhodospirillaceae bacterium]
MGSDIFTCVGIEIRGGQEPLFLPLIRTLGERHNSTIHLYVRSHEEEVAYRAHPERKLWQSVTNSNVHIPALRAEGLVERDVISRARKYETIIAEPINRLALSDRQLGFPFVAGAPRHPRAPFAEKASNTQLLHALSEAAAFWESEIKAKGLTILLDGSKIMACMARAQEVPYRRLCISRYESYFYWATDEYLTHPGLREAFDSLSEWPDVDIEAVYDVALEKYLFVSLGMRWRSLAKQMVMNSLRHFYYKARGMERGRAMSWRSMAFYPVMVRLAYNRFSKLAMATLKDLDGKTFVYYPLHKEPETALMQSSPEHLNQHATIISLARDLPAGVLLAIKENPSAVGRRPKNFYNEIAAIKNVVWLRPDTASIDVIKHAAATVTISGTASMEAAILGRPALTFSDRVSWNFLPHAVAITKESDLKTALDWAVNKFSDFDKARRDGARFVAALKM